MPGLEQSEETVRAFLRSGAQPEEAGRDGRALRRLDLHPAQPDGRRRTAAVHRVRQRFVDQFADLRMDLKRVIAEGDLVVTHSMIKTLPEDRGTAAADIFRLENGNVVEHSDVLQPVPETAANDNTMF